MADDIHDPAGHIAALKRDLADRDVLIEALQKELQVLRHRSWLTEACGDDMWDFESNG